MSNDFYSELTQDLRSVSGLNCYGDGVNEYFDNFFRACPPSFTEDEYYSWKIRDHFKLFYELYIYQFELLLCVNDGVSQLNQVDFFASLIDELRCHFYRDDFFYNDCDVVSYLVKYQMINSFDFSFFSKNQRLNVMFSNVLN